MKISSRIVARLSVYRRLLHELQAQGTAYVFSHDLAEAAGVSAVQVRRDVMEVGSVGDVNRGYNVQDLLRGIDQFLDHPDGQKVVIVGYGNLGKALTSYFCTHNSKLAIIAAFDLEEKPTGYKQCKCYSVEKLESFVAEKKVRIGIIAVPDNQAQAIAESLIRAGVVSIINFAPVPLKVPSEIYVEDVDITTSIEKAAFYSGKLWSERLGKENASGVRKH